LGAREIELYGADFSYPLGKTYTRGAYIYPYFEIRQNRLSPMEAQCSAFLFRSPSLQKICHTGGPGWYYETLTMRNYREGIEAKAGSIRAQILSAEGLGAPIHFMTCPPQTVDFKPVIPLFAAGKALMSAGDFLAQYRDRIAALPLPEKNIPTYLQDLTGDEKLVLTTLLPGAAAIKRRQGELKSREVLEAVRKYSLGELDRVLNASRRIKNHV
jgi:hypothetical protein